MIELNVAKYSAYTGTGLSVATVASGLENALGIILAVCTVISTVISLVSLITAGVKKCVKLVKEGKMKEAGETSEEMKNKAKEIVNEMKQAVAEMEKSCNDKKGDM